MRSPSGFTLLEVIIALTLAVMIVLAVTSVTRSSAATAREVKIATEDEARLAAALEVIRRDLAGWYETTSTPLAPEVLGPANLQNQELLLSFATLADSLEPGQAENFGAGPKRACFRIEYVALPRGSRFDLVRRGRVCAEIQDLILLTLDEKPAMSFWDGEKWSNQWTNPSPPSTLTIKVQGEAVVINSQP